jgi:hypothetical protein
VTSAYTPNLSTDEFYNPAINGKDPRVRTRPWAARASPTASSTTVPRLPGRALAGGSTLRYFVIYKDTGTATTSPLLVCIDTTTGATLPITTNGGDVTFTPDSGANKIFAL